MSTTPPTTTTVPNGTTPPTTTVGPPVTTTAPPSTVTRRYVGASTQATIPNDMTLFFQLLFGSGGLSEPSELAAPNVGMASFAVTGVYRTAGGGGGLVKGSLNGDIDNGQFTGTVVFEAPGCTAEREYSGTITAAALTLSGGVRCATARTALWGGRRSRWSAAKGCRSPLPY